MKKKTTTLYKHWMNILLILSVLFIFYLTMLPHQSLGIGMQKCGVKLNPFNIFHYSHSFYSTFIVNDIGNIVLFMPFGFVLAMRLSKLNKRSIVLVGCLLSIFIETVQLLFIPNRCTDIDDVFLNTLGTFLGCLCWNKGFASRR